MPLFAKLNVSRFESLVTFELKSLTKVHQKYFSENAVSIKNKLTHYYSLSINYFPAYTETTHLRFSTLFANFTRFP
jgi:hypothetical protein